MSKITVLDQNTIDKIAAGEVIERPASVVKELVENSIDAGATAVTVDIKEGGTSFIRITDNGAGIQKEDVPTAFLRHSTSKIRSVEDLASVTSLGFRGEALSSIAAVSQVELITKTAEGLTGVRYVIEGGFEKSFEEIGAPEGTTFIIRNLFYNTPARRKFLKSPAAEAGYISDLMERLALSHPDISFKFINNGQIKLHTSGNTNLKDIIYNVYGREIASHLIKIEADTDMIRIEGYIGKPLISRGNRNYENYYINGRYIKSGIVAKAIEDAYKSYMMQHKYPFTAIHLYIDGDFLDVNVHPTKMELRFCNQEEVYRSIFAAVGEGLARKELIPEVSLSPSAKPAVATKPRPAAPEPFEKNRLSRLNEERQQEPRTDMVRELAGYKAVNSKKAEEQMHVAAVVAGPVAEPKVEVQTAGFPPVQGIVKETSSRKETAADATVADFPKKGGNITAPSQLDLFDEKLLDRESKAEHRIIGQLFDTYWLVQFKDKLFIIDQHAAHEKVLYERIMKSLANREFSSQLVSPPVILSLSMQEEELLRKYRNSFSAIGFEIEHFGGKEYAVRAVPDNLFGIVQQSLLIEMIDSLSDNMGAANAEIINEKIASMSCKAAVKGNQRLSALEAEALIDELLELDNPYNCPHGRPTIISMSNYEIEKKFKRIV